MSDRMIPLTFGELFRSGMMEYRDRETLFGVKVVSTEGGLPIGPAAGPHTQLAENLVAAFASGASVMELKTVQIMEGEELGIQKPCIYVGHEVYNVEWSTELTVKQACDEYIKAYLLIRAFAYALNLSDRKVPEFIMSVGYDLEGIKSPKIDGFLNNMRDASETEEWKADIAWLRENTDFGEDFITGLELNSCISDTVTLSTMHGCPAEDIERIALYLISEKKFNVFIKMNPTLVGKERAREILAEKGYSYLSLSDDSFAHDITLKDAAGIVRNCQKKAAEEGKTFGVKMTNTFPVNITDNTLPGEQMYMSGPSLYALSVNAAAALFNEIKDLNISFSGGIDTKNIRQILETGIRPVTVSSFLLKPGGYGNIKKLITAAENADIPEKIDGERLDKAAGDAVSDKNFDSKKAPVFARKAEYSSICARCRNCVDVCPNRANARVTMRNGFDVVLHRNRLCNECGCCSCSCVMGHDPYLEKFTIYEDEEEFAAERAERDAVLVCGGKVVYRSGGVITDISDDLLEAVLQATGIRVMSSTGEQWIDRRIEQDNCIQESALK